LGYAGIKKPITYTQIPKYLMKVFFCSFYARKYVHASKARNIKSFL